MVRYPLLEVIITVGTWSSEAEAYPDTGFEGGLAIPRSLAREILADPDEGLLQLADGGLRRVDTWAGEVEIEGRPFPVEISSLGPRVLLGREVLDQMEISFVFGREVRLHFQD